MIIILWFSTKGFKSFSSPDYSTTLLRSHKNNLMNRILKIHFILILPNLFYLLYNHNPQPAADHGGRCTKHETVVWGSRRINQNFFSTKVSHPLNLKNVCLRSTRNWFSTHDNEWAWKNLIGIDFDNIFHANSDGANRSFLSSTRVKILRLESEILSNLEISIHQTDRITGRNTPDKRDDNKMKRMRKRKKIILGFTILVFCIDACIKDRWKCRFTWICQLNFSVSAGWM